MNSRATGLAPEAGRSARNHTAPPTAARLAVRNVSKSFAGRLALDSVSVELHPGEVHALLGENGSGKSTFIKVLSGYHKPDPGGSVEVDGRQLELGSPSSSFRAGCRFVHQDLGLVASSSVADNLCLGGGFPRRFGAVDRRRLERETTELFERLEMHVDPRAPVGALAPAARTAVAIARALRSSLDEPPRLLVLDEPTATLAHDEVDQLLGLVRTVANQGVSVIYVTHRLDEVFKVSAALTVLRDGKRIITAPTAEVSRDELLRHLLGRDLLKQRHRAEGSVDRSTAPMLDVDDVNGVLSLQARPGEVLGLAGLTGSGRDTVLGHIFGATARRGGAVRVDGVEVKPGNPRAAIAAGMAFVPAERMIKGAVMELSARENLGLTDLKPYWTLGFLRVSAETAEATKWFEQLKIRPAGAHNSPLHRFSGGNQQKVVLAKWLRRRPRVLLLDEPTQGVDVGAKAEIHRRLRAEATNGMSVVIASSDIDELSTVCDRVVVFRQGVMVAELLDDSITEALINHEVQEKEVCHQ